MTIQDDARRDANEMARAYVDFGKGAGNRRKLIKTKVEARAARSPEYDQAFRDAMDAQDMEKHVRAVKTKHNIDDSSSAIGRNARGLATGNFKQVDTSVLVALSGLILVNRLGWDRKLIDATRKKYRDIRGHFEAKKAFAEITTIRPEDRRP